MSPHLLDALWRIAVEAVDELRPPDPEAAGSWAALTETLRELHRRSGRPTYEALSARTGLPKSAISYLIGRNPVRQPSESTLLRFVEGCLAYAGRSSAEVAEQTSRWQRAYRGLERGGSAGAAGDDETGPAAASPGSPVTPSAPDAGAASPPAPDHRGSGRRRRGRALLLAAAGTSLVVVATAVVAGVARSQVGAAPAGAGPVPTQTGTAGRSTAAPGTSGGPEPAATATDVASAPHPTARCVERAEPQDDARMGRQWPTVFSCPNKPAKVYTWARADDRPISELESRSSWFVCWTQGRTRSGAPEVFYYTQGDTTRRRPELDAWGYVPASALAGLPAPAEGLTRPCPFPSSPGRQG